MTVRAIMCSQGLKGSDSLERQGGSMIIRPHISSHVLNKQYYNKSELVWKGRCSSSSGALPRIGLNAHVQVQVQIDVDAQAIPIAASSIFLMTSIFAHINIFQFGQLYAVIHILPDDVLLLYLRILHFG